jgi:hypothetical protein
MTSITADYGQQSTNWSDDDPSVFVANYFSPLYGEYQLCNGYGIANATQVLMVRYIYLSKKHIVFKAGRSINLLNKYSYKCN